MPPSARPGTAMVPSPATALAVLLLLLLAAPAEPRAASPLGDLVPQAPKSPFTNNGAGDICFGLLYGCSRDQRVADNWALIHACEAAAKTSAPVAVVRPGRYCSPRYRTRLLIS
jgi:hypothetical protein